MLTDTALRGQSTITSLPDEAFCANERMLRDVGLTPDDVARRMRDRVSAAQQAPGLVVRAVALGRRAIGFVRAWLEAAATARRHRRELNVLLEDGGRTARDIGLSHSDVIAIVRSSSWGREARELLHAAARRRDEGIAVAQKRAGPDDGGRRVACPSLVPGESPRR